MVARYSRGSWLLSRDASACSVCAAARSRLDAASASLAGRVALDLLVEARLRSLVETVRAGVQRRLPGAHIALLSPSGAGRWRVVVGSAPGDEGDELLSIDLYPELEEVRRTASPAIFEEPTRTVGEAGPAWIGAYPVFVAEGTAEAAVLRIALPHVPAAPARGLVELFAHLLAHRLSQLDPAEVARALGVPHTPSNPFDPSRLLRYLPLPACLVDDDGVAAHTNPQALRLLERQTDGDQERLILRTKPTHPWRSAARWDATVHTGRARRRVLAWSGAVLDDNWLVVLDDHPESLRAARESRIRSALDGKVAALEQANQRLEQYAVLSERFVSDAAHELKTPLAILRSYLETLASDLSDGMSQQQAEFVRACLEGAGRLQRLVDELLDLAALDSGGTALDLGPVFAAPVVKSVVAAIDTLTRANDMRIRVSLTNLPAVRADAERLERVMRNLLENAVKYGRRGGLATVSGEVRGDRVVLVVTDDGPGIEPAMLPSIFDEFVRGGEPTRRPGAGLGLAIVRRLVQAMAGRVWAESESGGGSSFFVELPIWTETG